MIVDDLAPMVWRDPDDKRDDRSRIDDAFRALRKLGYTAKMNARENPCGDRAVYWLHDQEARAFGEGQLRTRNLQYVLLLHWRGNIEEIVSVLEAEGLRVVVGNYLLSPIGLYPMPLNQHLFIPKPCAVAARDYRRGCYVCGGQHTQIRKHS